MMEMIGFITRLLFLDGIDNAETAAPRCARGHLTQLVSSVIGVPVLVLETSAAWPQSTTSNECSAQLFADDDAIRARDEIIPSMMSSVSSYGEWGRSRALTSVKVWWAEVMGLKIAPDRLDFIEFGGVFRQPLDGEPVCACGQGGERAFAGVDRTIVLDQHDRPGLSPGLRSKETVELLQMGDETRCCAWSG